MPIDFTSHPQFQYSQDINAFHKARCDYYSDKKIFSKSDCKKNFVRDYTNELFSEGFDLQKSIDKIEKSNPDVIIVTSNYNRYTQLERLYESIASQAFCGRIAWVIIENGSNEHCQKLLDTWSLWHDWIIVIKYKAPFGYAAPARNRGFDFIQMSLEKYKCCRWIWSVDSDDYLYNEFVTRELYKSSKKKSTILIHGYTVVLYHDQERKTTLMNTIPRNIGAGFPLVTSIKDEFEMGPQILAGWLPSEYLPFFRYPDEFTMEDDALNIRIMAWSKTYLRGIVGIEFPSLVKTFHSKSMSGSNDKVGDSQIKVMLGPKIVTGIRAQVVKGLIHMRDFFTREKL